MKIRGQGRVRNRLVPSDIAHPGTLHKSCEICSVLKTLEPDYSEEARPNPFASRTPG